MKIKVAPSLLASDITDIVPELARIKNADMLHIDVMDGHFVNNLSFGPCVTQSIRAKTSLPLDVHLMVERPLKFIAPFADAGADIITFHIEAADDALDCINAVRALGKKVGVVLNPNTDASAVFHLKGLVDMVLQMTVYPGFGGQSMAEEALANIPRIRAHFGDEADIEVDGGVNAENAPQLIKLGANVLVAGTAVFGAQDAQGVINKLRG